MPGCMLGVFFHMIRVLALGGFSVWGLVGRPRRGGDGLSVKWVRGGPVGVCWGGSSSSRSAGEHAVLGSTCPGGGFWDARIGERKGGWGVGEGECWATVVVDHSAVTRGGEGWRGGGRGVIICCGCALWRAEARLLCGEPSMWMISGMVNEPTVCWLAMLMILFRCASA